VVLARGARRQDLNRLRRSRRQTGSALSLRHVAFPTVAAQIGDANLSVSMPMSLRRRDRTRVVRRVSIPT
jgi:hypothetical protein